LNEQLWDPASRTEVTRAHTSSVKPVTLFDEEQEDKKVEKWVENSEKLSSFRS
jgi:hypothetical protein